MFDFVLFRTAERNGRDNATVRCPFRIVFKRFWPFSYCYVSLNHGCLRAGGRSVVLGFRRNMYGSAFMNAMKNAGISVSVGGSPLDPWLANGTMVEEVGKTIGRMFRKEDEFLVCRRLRF